MKGLMMREPMMRRSSVFIAAVTIFVASFSLTIFNTRAAYADTLTPANGSTLSGYATLSVTPGGSNASSCSGASTEIDVYNSSNTQVGYWTNSGGPLSIQWLTDTVPNGSYTVTAKWTDTVSSTCQTLVQQTSSVVSVDNGPKPYVGAPGATPSRPVTCPPVPANQGGASNQTETLTGTFPWPPPPAGTNPTDYASYANTPNVTPPIRPANWNTSGYDWMLTSARYVSPDPSFTQVTQNPQELCGVGGNSVDTAWQTTTGWPTTVIASIDSGIEWCNTAIVNKLYINTAALPLPENAGGLTKPQLEAQGVKFLDSNPYDLNNSGVINALQYANDPRIQKPYFCEQTAGENIISPADLINTFGTPSSPYYYNQQGPQGFTEAISGWNFVNNNNNPYDVVQYGHGTGRAVDMAGAANTTGGTPGTCPNCMIMPIRAGDSFMGDGNTFGEGVLFAVDSGAAVISSAQGLYNITPIDRQAIAYADAHGVPIISSAADEHSLQHNLPTVLEHLIVASSVINVNQATGMNLYNPPSSLYVNGCTNYGPNITVVVESEACSSQATGNLSGILGLAESAGKEAVAKGTITPYPGLTTVQGAPVALSANEIKQ
ncbi:MAG: S8 family serine peptidase, partial [Actinobacteria bacterium]|nr:S8 family serine peptidase [Actinomycetota bacterium]